MDLRDVHLAGMTGMYINTTQGLTTISCTYCKVVLAFFAIPFSGPFNFSLHESTSTHLSAVRKVNEARYAHLIHRLT